MAKRRKQNVRKHHPAVYIIAFLLIVAILVGLYFYFFHYKGYTWDDLLGTNQPITDPQEKPEQKPNTQSSGGVSKKGTIQTEEMSVHFLQLGETKEDGTTVGVNNTGDCTLIKVGNTEVLIDAGAKSASAEVIVPYIQKYCKDGVLEYVIATHAHEDHISAFYSEGKNKGVFESFECQTIIDFPKTNNGVNGKNPTKTYQKYIAARDNEVKEGATHYTALQCYNETDGAQQTYQLSENVSFQILYQEYYEKSTSDSENDYSVCVLFTQGDYHYLFTGDLESKGEASLVKNNELPHCELYKGGHHGSSTSSTDVLLNAITPDNICMCSCMGSPEYVKKVDATDGMFPTKKAVDRMAKHTRNIYVTSVAYDVKLVDGKVSWKIKPLNGDIVVRSNGIDFSITGSNNSTILKDTEWFKANRTWNGK